MDSQAVRMNRRIPRNFTYVSATIKFTIFVLNFLFWLFGGLLIGVGLYAFLDKWKVTGNIGVNTIYDVLLDISLILIIFGSVVFIVSFAGCLGALRENTCLLKFYSLFLLVFFILEISIAMAGLVFSEKLLSTVEESFTDKVIHKYRENDDLRNFIDFTQKEFHCCGLSSEGYKDWAMNEYFNCSSPSSEKCGVPFSCCINATNVAGGLINIMCGYGVQELPIGEASKKIWTNGCIEAVRAYATRNLYHISMVALGVALFQLFVIYCAKSLEGQILTQKARWES